MFKFQIEQSPNRSLLCDWCIVWKNTNDGAIDKLKLTARSYHKLHKLVRTIADMADLKDIRQAHLLEAISYRQQDKRRH